MRTSTGSWGADAVIVAAETPAIDEPDVPAWNGRLGSDLECCLRGAVVRTSSQRTMGALLARRQPLQQHRKLVSTVARTICDHPVSTGTAEEDRFSFRPWSQPSGCRDLNPGPLDPQSSALTKLRHSPHISAPLTRHRYDYLLNQPSNQPQGVNEEPS